MNNNARDLDIRPMWKNVIRRVQSVARQHEGLALVNIIAIVNTNGDPIFYTEPKMVKIEPKKRVTLEGLMEDLTEDDLQWILEQIIVRS